MKTQKKIINFGPSLDDQGGVVTVIKGIINLDFSEEIVIKSIATTKATNKINTFIKCIFNTIKIFLKKECDIVHIHMASKGSFCRKSIIVLISKIFNIPIIIHVHGACFKEFYANMNIPMKKYCKYIFKNSNKVIVLTKKWEEFFSKFVDSEKIEIVSNFISLPDNKIQIEKELNNAKSVKKILFLGRLGQRKGTYDLIDAVEILNDKNIAFKLILAGDGEVEICKSKIKAKGIEDKVKIVGWIGDREKENYLRKADILVLPSYFESFGLSLIEAMSYKVPVIASWGGEMSEVVRDNKDGFLVTPGNIIELSSKLELLILNDKLREEYGKKGYERVINKFTDKIAKEKLQLIYKDILKKNNRNNIRGLND